MKKLIQRFVAPVVVGLIVSVLSYVGVDLTSAEQLELTTNVVGVLSVVGIAVAGAAWAWIRKRFPLDDGS